MKKPKAPKITKADRLLALEADQRAVNSILLVFMRDVLNLSGDPKDHLVALAKEVQRRLRVPRDTANIGPEQIAIQRGAAKRAQQLLALLAVELRVDPADFPKPDQSH